MPIKTAVLFPHPPIILPEIGRGDELKIQKTIEAYRIAAAVVAGLSPAAVLLISPHAACYGDYFHISPGAGAEGDFSRFHAGQVSIKAVYDEALAKAIAKEASHNGIPAGFLGEDMPELDHGAMIPLHFLWEAMDASTPIVRISVSGLSALTHYRMGMCIQAAAKGKEIAIIASGDLSHCLKEDGPYGYRPEGPALDAAILRVLETGDFGKLINIPGELREKGAECGLSPILMMAGALDGHCVEPRLLSYEGPFGVGYAVATFIPGTEDKARYFAENNEQEEKHRVMQDRAMEHPYVGLARLAIENKVCYKKDALLPRDLPIEYRQERAGVFVSLHRHGALRGCIGTIFPTTACLGEEIIQNAVSAALEDPRFAPVEPYEIDSITIKVDVLQKPEGIESIEALDPSHYGVIVTLGSRRGVLLPDLPGVDTAREQVEIACRKAGIGREEPFTMERFMVARYT